MQFVKRIFTQVTDQFGQCETGGGNTPGYIYPIGGREENPEEEADNPCKRAKATTTYPKFTSSVNTLQGKTDLKRETGYTLSHDPQPQFLDSPLGSTEISSNNLCVYT